MNRRNVIKDLNRYQLFQSVGDYEECLGIIRKLKTQKKNQQMDSNIVEQIVMLTSKEKDLVVALDEFRKEKGRKSDFNFEKSIFASNIVYKDSELSYIIRMVINQQECWNPKSPPLIEGITLSSEELNPFLETIYIIERQDLFGELHFSSLGIVEGKIYENKGRNAPDRTEVIREIVYKLATGVYLNTKDKDYDIIKNNNLPVK
ncbi:hypothetical protein PQ796_16510 [Priestia megaterium]|uniref:hypothetical protein n=1 Tax=Priestia megaterium TaxID=1404 RepID=UPI0024479979|nr:hypothetical protein [Priestia megaterium]MDH2452139.1 hypothetical protein [Priestia megaterium]MDL5151596.1 hypothetical protein [Priestia megaterium]